MFKDLPTTFQGLHSIFKDHLLCGNSGGVGEEVGGGGHQFLTNMENPRRWGGSPKRKSLWGGVWIFSGTTHL